MLAITAFQDPWMVRGGDGAGLDNPIGPILQGQGVLCQLVVHCRFHSSRARVARVDSLIEGQNRNSSILESKNQFHFA